MLFFTNNICESLNRSLARPFILLKNCITDILDLYNNNKIYKEKNISVTRSLEH